MHLAWSIVLSNLNKRIGLYSTAGQNHIHLSIGEAIARIAKILEAKEAVSVCKAVSNDQMLIGEASH